MIDPDRKAAIRDRENPDIDGRPKTGRFGDDPLLEALVRAHPEMRIRLCLMCHQPMAHTQFSYSCCACRVFEPHELAQ